MFHCSAHRSDALMSLLVTTFERAPGRSLDSGALTNANAAGLNRNCCREDVAASVPATVFVAPTKLIAAPFAGEPTTVCSCPLGMIAGLIGSAAVPVPARSAVKTNRWGAPVVV